MILVPNGMAKAPPNILSIPFPFKIPSLEARNPGAERSWKKAWKKCVKVKKIKTKNSAHLFGPWSLGSAFN
jgi:hypothetical protein